MLNVFFLLNSIRCLTVVHSEVRATQEREWYLSMFSPALAPKCSKGLCQEKRPGCTIVSRVQRVSVSCCSVAQSYLHFVTQWTAAHQASLSFIISQSLLKPMCIESVMLSSHLILCCPLLLLLSIFSIIRVFSSEVALHIRQPKYWSFSFSISLCNEYSGLISLRIDCFDLADQGTLKSLSQHYSSKASILWHSVFFMVQLSHLYMTTGKTIALTIGQCQTY